MAENLFLDFPHATQADWRRRLAAAGTDLEDLVSHSWDGFEIQPLYGPEPPQDPGLPGQAPFLRGRALAPGWRRAQELEHPDPAIARGHVEQDQNRQVEGFWLRFDSLLRHGIHPLDLPAEQALDRLARGGLAATRVQALTQLLAGVDLGRQHLFLEAGAASRGAAALTVEAAAQLGWEPRQLQAFFGVDPATTLLRASAGEASFRTLEELARFCLEEAPGCRAATVSTAAVHGAGASPAQELGYALAAATESLRRLLAAGLTLEQAAGQFLVSVSVTGELFLEIAKLRAARLLWSRWLEASGAAPEAGALLLHARTSRRRRTLYDRGVNALRGTVETFAAVVGGADWVTTAPYDEALGLPTRFGRKVAANTQLILREESFLAQVQDPAGGSWALEALTEKLAAAGWQVFREIEAEGGLVAAVAVGTLQARLAETESRRQEALARRRQPLTGVSEFPNLEEAATSPARAAQDRQAAEQRLRILQERGRAPGPEAPSVPTLEALRQALRQGLAVEDLIPRRSSPVEAVAALTSGLPEHRDAEAFEALRARSLAVADRRGARPRVFLACLGPLRQHRLRATFSRHLLAAGGIEAVDGGATADAAAVAEAFRASGLEAAVLCGDDPSYQAWGVSAAAALSQAGAAPLLLAGNPGGREKEWRAAGVGAFLFQGCDAVALLDGLLKHWEVSP